MKLEKEIDSSISFFFAGPGRISSREWKESPKSPWACRRVAWDAG